MENENQSSKQCKTDSSKRKVRTCNASVERSEIHLLDVADAAQVLGQREGSLASLEAGLSLADEPDDDAWNRASSIGTTEVQLLDLRGPRQGRHQLEGVSAVDILAAADVELDQSTKLLEGFEWTCIG